MKVGLVCPYNMAKGGGVQELIRALQIHLERRGHIAKILAARPSELGNTDTNGVLFLGKAVDVKWPTGTVAPITYSTVEEIRRVLDAEKFDVMHFQEPWVPMLSRQILSYSKSVNVATFHAKIPENKMGRTMAKAVAPGLKPVLKHLDELTAVSKPAAEYVSTMTTRPITIIPNGIEVGNFTFAPSSNVGSPKTIFYLGRLEPRKGLVYLLKAYQILAAEDKDLQLIIAGAGPDRQKLEKYVKDWGLQHVHFLGYVSEEKKHSLLQSADVFCSPAVYGESFGIVLLEAMASGLVTVAGDNPGYASVMQGFGAISLVSPKATVDFARRLKLALQESQLRDSWRKWAQEYVKQFNYEQVVDKYEKLYQVAFEKHAKHHRIMSSWKQPAHASVLS